MLSSKGSNLLLMLLNAKFIVIHSFSSKKLKQNEKLK